MDNNYLLPSDWVGADYIERSDYFDIATGRTTSAPTKRLRIVDVKPCDDLFYAMTGADPDVPRWEVTAYKVRPNGTLATVAVSLALTADAEVVPT